MSDATGMTTRDAGAPEAASHAALRGLTIGIMAFLTVVDLFGTQAILPTLARAYRVNPAVMGLAVNATTFGMAFASLATALAGHRIRRRLGVVTSLLLLAIPTALLATMPPLGLFAVLRVTQGIFMATAFTLTLAYLGEECSASAATGAFAAYITGNVASNLVGRLISAGLADHFGLSWNFLGFAALNLAGAALAATILTSAAPQPSAAAPAAPLLALARHWRNPTLRAAYGIGFCILFAFLGIFTYVNFVLSGAPFGIGAMRLGFVYFVFLPSIFTTPLAGTLADRLGSRRALIASLALALLALPMLVAPSLTLVVAGLILVAVGTFAAQAVATGVVGRAASGGRAAASGLYLAAYYLGGLIGTAILGQVFMPFGWPGCIAGVALALLAAAALAASLPARIAPATPQ